MSAFVLTAGLVAEAAGGQLVAGDASRVFDAVVTDTRAMAAPVTVAGSGPLFIALAGPNFDANDFVSEAVARGAAGVLVSRRPVDAGTASVILVDDTTVALQRLGREVRRRSGARVIAVTGSAGKTTTKDAIAALLRPLGAIFATAGNLNNHIGLPLSLLELRHGAGWGVFELGMNHAGEIRLLVSLAQPDIRVWTNVGDAHIGHFGSRDAIADAKAEIFDGADQATVSVVNADDPLVVARLDRVPGRIWTFGIEAAADVQARRVEDRGFDGTDVEATTPWGPLDLRVALPGRANVLNVLAAATVALECGVSTADVSAGAAALSPATRRGVSTVTAAGVRVVDDSYNASPSAVRAALHALRMTPGAGRRIAVVGEMLELGDDARRWHHACGREAVAQGIDVLVAVGGEAADGLVEGAVAAGLPAASIARFTTSAAAADAMPGLVRPGDLVLVKGSRGTRTDLIVDALTGRAS